MVFDTTRQFFQDYVNDGKRASPLQRMVCGALAALIAQTCTYPFDIVRRRNAVGDPHERAAKVHDDLRGVLCVAGVMARRSA